MYVNAAASTTLSAKTASPVARCPKCGKLKKSGKPNCCAPGGAWFNKCGSSGDSKFDHTWAEGNDACKKKSPREYIDMYYSFVFLYLFRMPTCPYLNCSVHDDSFIGMFQVRLHQEIWTIQLLRSWWGLVQELWESRRLQV